MSEEQTKTRFDVNFSDLAAANWIYRWFDYRHLPEGGPRDVSKEFADIAEKLMNFLPADPETTAGLRKLLEAKDCFVRSAIADKLAQEAK